MEDMEPIIGEYRSNPEERAATKIIKGGTPSGESPCLTCEYGDSIKGYKQTEEMILCSNYNVVGSNGARVLSFVVARCSLYERKGFVSVSELKQSAWILKITKHKTAGLRGGETTEEVKFVPPEK
jgi:hypothetical protein